MLIGIIIAVIILIILAAYIIKTYNKFISFGERVSNGTAQIATQIESRWDALTSLIQATKRYSAHEAETLEKVVAQRTKVTDGSSVGQLEKGEGELNNVLGRLLAITEAYPDLKASSIYQETMQNIDRYENNVRNARMIYNDVVTRFNRLVRMFPSNLVAMMFGFKTKEYFKATETKQDMPSWDD